MSSLRDLSRVLAKKYNITIVDASEIIQSVNEDIIYRLGRGEVVHVERFGSFHAEGKKIWFNPSEYLQKYINDRVNEKKVPKEKARGDRWKHLHERYIEKLNKQKEQDGAG